MLDDIVFSLKFLPKYSFWRGHPINNGCPLYCPYPKVISKSESSNLTVVNFWQSKKQPEPIFVTFPGIVISFKLRESNAPIFSSLNDLGKSIFSNNPQ